MDKLTTADRERIEEAREKLYEAICLLMEVEAADLSTTVDLENMTCELENSISGLGNIIYEDDLARKEEVWGWLDEDPCTDPYEEEQLAARMAM